MCQVDFSQVRQSVYPFPGFRFGWLATLHVFREGLPVAQFDFCIARASRNTAAKIELDLKVAAVDVQLQYVAAVFKIIYTQGVD